MLKKAPISQDQSHMALREKIQLAKRQWISQPLFGWFRRALPPMSVTEKQAISAGDVDFEQSLFQGKPDWVGLFDAPAVTLTEAETAFLNGPVSHLCKMIDDWKIVELTKDLPPEVWHFIKKEKFFGLILPTEFGGLGFSALAHSAIITKIASRSITAAVTCMVPNSLGPGELLHQYGTAAQKSYYLPRLAEGLEIPCFALTGPEAGSDASSMPDTGVIQKGIFENKEIIGILLNFDKRYITLAPVATVMGLAFQLSDPDHLLGDKIHLGITVCLIPTHHPGISIGQRHNPLDLPFMNGPIRGKNVFIPLDWIIGGPEMVGQGWRMLMECLAAGRGISLPALSTATAQVAYRMTGAYATIRRQFNAPLSTFDGVRAALARIGGYTYLLEATRLFVAGVVSQGKHPAVATSIAKYHMTELARKVINDAMDVHGGKGIMLGPHNYLARAYQGVPISITVEGANIVTRCLMIFGQGAFRCHPFVQAEMKAAELADTDPEKALDDFNQAVSQHQRYFFKNLGKTCLYALSVGYLAKGNRHSRFSRHIQKINWLSAGLALTADVSFAVLGGGLKRKELLSARLGDILSALYMSAAVIKFAQESDPQGEEQHYGTWVLQTLGYEAQEAFYAFFENAPHMVFKFLKWIVFPYGRRFSLPKDKLNKKLVQQMITNNPLRDKLTTLCFIEDNPDDAKGLVEMAFQSRLKNEPIFEKIQAAVKAKILPKKGGLLMQAEFAVKQKLISEAEFDSLKTYQMLYERAIAVDEFNPVSHKDMTQ